ncbi:MAG: hypothetical protein J6L23_00670, partial [Clostridia bacterium]|nr:hypothetical protein [Clostridia bacterium]
ETLLFQKSDNLSADNLILQYWYIGTTELNNHFTISASDTSKSLAINSDGVYVTTGTLTSWSFEKCPTFYGQHVSTINGHKYWNDNHLYNFYFPESPDGTGDYEYSKMPFIALNVNNDYVMKRGCSIAAIAMILDNMGVKSIISKNDIRNGTSDYLIPDPFTCTLANVNYFYNFAPNVYYNTTKSRYECDAEIVPTTANWDNIADQFGKNTTYFSFDSNDSAKDRAIIIKTKLNENPEGVIIRVGNNHSIVITKFIEPSIEPEEDDYDGWTACFIVYDPAGKTQPLGSGNYWNLTRTYQVYQGLENVNGGYIVN